jgi:serine/threonine-protein kinase
VDLAREKHILELVEAALEHPGPAREQFLRERTASDRTILDDAIDLLRAAENVDLPTALPMAASGLQTPPPERIGPYRMGELLGRGGMGRVFAAERIDGMFEHSVAIKLMNRTLLSNLLQEQFARERQILARLHHRNIAQLFDGGITEDGYSYFVMELVRGRTITAYAKEAQLTLAETLKLFMQICAALQYAHSRLVVHADIKPNNILVTEDGSVKLLDFGVAHAVNAGEQRAAPVGLTAAYASPARQRGEPPTTADDVYSLGVLLAELVERTPAAPPDVRSICGKARAEEAEARYGSVEALRKDIQRWLDRRPVAAHAGGMSYATGKLFARHRLAFAMTLIGVVSVLGATIALAMLYQRAEQARLRADERFSDARQLSHDVLFDVYDRLESVPRSLALRRDIADAAQQYLDRLAHDPAAPLEVRLEVIEGLRRLAQVQAQPGSANLQQSRQGRANLARAIQLAQSLPADAAEHTNRSIVLATLQLTRARIASDLDQNLAEAHQALDACEVHLEAARAKAPHDPRVRSLQIDFAVQQAATLQWQGQYRQAIATARDALEEQASHSANDRRQVLQRARLLDILAESIYYAGDVPAAERSYRDEYDVLAQMCATSPHDVALQRALGTAAWQLGTTLIELHNEAEAESILANGHAIFKQLTALDPEDADLARRLDIVANAHAQALAALHRYAEAIPVLENSARVRQEKWQHAPENWSAARDYAITSAMLADVRADAGSAAAACANYSSAIDTFERIRAAGRLSKLDEEHALALAEQAMERHCPASRGSNRS